MNDIYIFHHDDLDGITSKLILKNHYYNVNCIECSYEDELINPLDYVDYKDVVIIVDYSFSPEIMKKLYTLLKDRVIWLDHHISAINKSIEYGYDKIQGIRDVNYCGAELSWQWCFPNKEIPELIKGIGDFDTFRTYGTKEFEKTLCLFYGIKTYDDFALFKAIETYYHKKEYEDIWYDMFFDAGKIVYKYKINEYKENGIKYSYVKNIWGLRVLCMNTSDSGICLQLPKIYDYKKHDMILTYNYNGKEWCYGFYTDTRNHPEVDCSKIAIQYGGGGHKGAAGATSKELIKELL